MRFKFIKNKYSDIISFNFQTGLQDLHDFDFQ